MLHNKYQPKTFDKMLGNEEIVAKLQSYIRTGIIPRCLLFSGERGSGKSTSAEIIANAIPDASVEVIDAAVDNGVEVSRTIATQAYDVPIGYKNKVYILEEIMNVSAKFFDALLVITNNPPPNTYFIMCTTEPNKIRPTVRSRFIEFKFVPPSFPEMKKHLIRISDEEGALISKKIANKICLKNGNIPRDCLTDLELVLGLEEDAQKALLEKEVEESSNAFKIAQELNKGCVWKDLKPMVQGITEQEVEASRITICNYFNKVILDGRTDVKKVKDCALVLESFSKPFEFPMKTGFILACYENS